MHLYRQSIALFGIVLPLLAFAALAGILLFAKGKVGATHESRAKMHRNHLAATQNAESLHREIDGRRDDIERWNHRLGEEVATVLTPELRALEDQLPAKEFQRGFEERELDGGLFSSVAAQSSDQLKLSFRGTFRTVQQAFLQLESRLPRLQLESLEVQPASAPNTLEFSAAFSSWKP